MKYIIDVPEEIAKISEEFLSKAGLLCEPYTEPDLNPLVDEAVEAIENEVWELADYMSRMSLTERDLCFGFPLPQEVTMNLSYNEAKSKFETWLERNEIHIGDEVVDKAGYKGVVTYIQSEVCDVLWDDGNVTEDTDKKEFSKTGRHFDEVEELLEKMRGDKE
jgi:preprotein translocase subunit YajC